MSVVEKPAKTKTLAKREMEGQDYPESHVVTPARAKNTADPLKKFPIRHRKCILGKSSKAKLEKSKAGNGPRESTIANKELNPDMLVLVYGCALMTCPSYRGGVIIAVGLERKVILRDPMMIKKIN